MRNLQHFSLAACVVISLFASPAGAQVPAPQWAVERLAAADANGTSDGDASAFRLSEPAWVPDAANPASARVLVEFTFRDTKGVERTGKAKVYLPPELENAPESKVPMIFAAGYEVDDGGAARFVKRGWILVSPRELEANPLVRSVNPDVVLLHWARGLPNVDNARVLIAGGSAGGYMALMLAAETFPVAGVMSDVPPFNLGYNAAYFFTQKKLVMPQQTGQPWAVPVLGIVIPALEPMLDVYGPDMGDDTWRDHSPLAHLPTITAPVSVWWSTADVLVPIDQVGSKWVQPFDPLAFPEGFTMLPEGLLATVAGQARLEGVLDHIEHEIFVFSLPEGTLKSPLPEGSGPPPTLDLPASDKHQWSITILDEGAPEPQVGHAKYAFVWTHEPFIKRVLADGIGVDQLTSAKLARLMDRYAGKEWLPTPLVHLDSAAREQADVLAGLRTFVIAGRAHAQRFEELYAALPDAQRELPEEVVAELTGAVKR